MTPIDRTESVTSENGVRPRPRPRSARVRPDAIVAALLQDGWRFAAGGDDLYVYQNGVYVPGSRVLRKHLFERLGSQWEPARVTAVIQALKDSSESLWEVPSAEYINLKNGLYNRATGLLEPHSPEHFSPVQLPVSFDPAATCPRMDGFLEAVFPLDSEILAYEILGYLATTDTWLKRAVFLLGPKNSGKSTWCELVRRFIGSQNISGVPLQSLASNRFALAGLHGKLVNVFPDLSPTRVEDSSIFKQVTGDDKVVTAEKKFEAAFQFYLYCRLVFSGNEVPQSADQTDAYLDRWLVLLFPNRFELNQSFLADLATPEEFSGLFNASMQAYQGVQDRQDFTSNEATREGADRFKEAVVPVISFLAECCETVNPNARCDRVDLYQAYCGWSSQSGRRRPSNRKFYEALRQHFPRGGEHKIEGNRIWTHITLNDAGSQALEYFHNQGRRS